MVITRCDSMIKMLSHLVLIKTRCDSMFLGQDEIDQLKKSILGSKIQHKPLLTSASSHLDIASFDKKLLVYKALLHPHSFSCRRNCSQAFL